MNIRIGVHSFSNIADIEMADEVALTAIWNRLEWADRAEAWLRTELDNIPDGGFKRLGRKSILNLLNQLEPKDNSNADHS